MLSANLTLTRTRKVELGSTSVAMQSRHSAAEVVGLSREASATFSLNVNVFLLQLWCERSLSSAALRLAGSSHIHPNFPALCTYRALRHVLS